MLRVLIPLLLVVTITIIGIVYSYNIQHPNIPAEVCKPAPIGKSLVQFTKEDLLDDIKQYDISTKTQHDIVNTIVAVSKEYDMNPLILYSLIHVESSMKFWVIHNQVTITIKDKTIKTNAIGLGGVIYEWWGAKLIAAKIIDHKSDLYKPVENIRAVGFIYNQLYNTKLHKDATNKDESAMLRYFGGSFKAYSEKIDNKIGEMISKKLYRF